MFFNCYDILVFIYVYFARTTVSDLTLCTRNLLAVNPLALCFLLTSWSLSSVKLCVLHLHLSRFGTWQAFDFVIANCLSKCVTYILYWWKLVICNGCYQKFIIRQCNRLLMLLTWSNLSPPSSVYADLPWRTLLLLNASRSPGLRRVSYCKQNEEKFLQSIICLHNFEISTLYQVLKSVCYFA